MTKEQRQQRLFDLMSQIDIKQEVDKNRHVAELLNVTKITVEVWKSRPVKNTIPISKLKLLEFYLNK